MTRGIGGSSAENELARLNSLRDKATPVSLEDHLSRIERVRNRMQETGVDALYLDATTSLRYFTGLYCYPSERLHGAIISADQLFYVCPAFEEEKTRAGMIVDGDFVLWQEHENPTAAVTECV